ncbi:MAG: ATP-binding cassette domain-containing protein [Firmicutes bacterium]|jgi:putative ABC transport system ATP-binding protein|nr:ATP-binding cassette domain-containing protein [Bacillota bacterium]
MLEIRQLSKTFNAGSVNEKKALDRLSLTVEEGDFITIIGSNGAGKSTLLNCINGCLPIDSGEIIMDGKLLNPVPEHTRAFSIARLFQDPMMGTAGSMTVEENMAMALKRGRKRRLAAGITRCERSYFREQLVLLGLGLEDRLRLPVRLLSGGQRQALTLLMATMARPRLMLLDEHTSALDPKTALEVMRLTKVLIEDEGITTLMVTHNLEQALNIGNRTIMMHEGRIILDLKGKSRRDTSVSGLLEMFHRTSGANLAVDRMLLA